MFFQPLIPRRLLTLVLVVFCIFLMTALTSAQDKPPAPQFLYRSGDHLVLLNGYTGESSQLPITISDQDHFDWSPDGKYLVTRLHTSDYSIYCLDLYDVDKRVWVLDKPISCAAGEAIFSGDNSRIYYSTNEQNNGAVWVYRLQDKTSRQLYQTTEGNDLRPAGVDGLYWSPTKAYLTFVEYNWIMGGTLNSFEIMNAATEHIASVNASNPYYASYYPIWRPDDRWFLITLQDQYVTSGTLPRTNDQGDVYLVNSETGGSYRLTYTPSEYETDIRWTDDGKIAFNEVTEQHLTYTLQQAMNVPVVPDDQIVAPEPINPEDDYDPMQGVMVSPDPDLGAWVSPEQEGIKMVELHIGNVLGGQRMATFSILIPASYQYPAVLIGWRPSDYPYPYG